MHELSRPRPVAFAASTALLMAALVTACAVPGAPPDVLIYPKGLNGPANNLALALEVNFEQRIINIDIQGERYTGQLAWAAEYRSYQARLLASNGANMECFLAQVLAKVWHGECHDSLGREYVIEVGHPWSV